MPAGEKDAKCVHPDESLHRGTYFADHCLTEQKSKRNLCLKTAALGRKNPILSYRVIKLSRKAIKSE